MKSIIHILGFFALSFGTVGAFGASVYQKALDKKTGFG
jgi:hypothetical protein